MKSDAAEIAKSIESGDYYENAKQWYSQKYLMAHIERSYVIILAFFAIIISIISFNVIVGFLPLSKKVNFAVSISDQSDYFATIQHIGPRNEPYPDHSVSELLTSHFVDAWESYDYEDDYAKLVATTNSIEQFATPDILLKYKQETYNLGNLNSQKVRYRNYVKRDIKVLDNRTTRNRTTYRLQGGHKQKIDRKRIDNGIDPASEPYKATILFDATEISETGQKTTRWKAEIDFYYTNVSYDTEKGEFNPIQFEVIGYKSSQIEG